MVSIELAALVVAWRWALDYRQDHREGNGLALVLFGGLFWLLGAAFLLRSFVPSELNPNVSRRLSLTGAVCGAALALAVVVLARSAAG